MQKKEDKRNRWLHRVRLGLCLALVFTLGMAVGGVLHIPLFSRAQELLNLTAKGDNAQKYQEVMQIMSEDWFFAADIPNVRQRLLDQALIGMTTNTEDAHTAYMTEEEIQTFTQSINRNFVGIGVQYRSTDDGLHIITAIMPDSPAEKAGVQAGDIIHAVDGKVVDALNAQEIRALVQGEEGTTVTIDFLRDGNGDLETEAGGSLLDGGERCSGRRCRLPAYSAVRQYDRGRSAQGFGNLSGTGSAQAAHRPAR